MRTPNTSPIFKHGSCGKCQFMGHCVVDGVPLDFYCCDSGHGVRHEMISLIARHGDEPDAYICALAGYASPLSVTAMLGLALYSRHIEATASSGFWKGTLHKDGNTVMRIQ